MDHKMEDLDQTRQQAQKNYKISKTYMPQQAEQNIQLNQIGLYQQSQDLQFSNQPKNKINQSQGLVDDSKKPGQNPLILHKNGTLKDYLNCIQKTLMQENMQILEQDKTLLNKVLIRIAKLTKLNQIPNEQIQSDRMSHQMPWLRDNYRLSQQDTCCRDSQVLDGPKELHGSDGVLQELKESETDGKELQIKSSRNKEVQRQTKETTNKQLQSNATKHSPNLTIGKTADIQACEESHQQSIPFKQVKDIIKSTIKNKLLSQVKSSKHRAKSYFRDQINLLQDCQVNLQSSQLSQEQYLQQRIRMNQLCFGVQGYGQLIKEKEVVELGIKFRRDVFMGIVDLYQSQGCVWPSGASINSMVYDVKENKFALGTRPFSHQPRPVQDKSGLFIALALNRQQLKMVSSQIYRSFLSHPQEFQAIPQIIAKLFPVHAANSSGHNLTIQKQYFRRKLQNLMVEQCNQRLKMHQPTKRYSAKQIDLSSGKYPSQNQLQEINNLRKIQEFWKQVEEELVFFILNYNFVVLSWEFRNLVYEVTVGECKIKDAKTDSGDSGDPIESQGQNCQRFQALNIEELVVQNVTQASKLNFQQIYQMKSVQLSRSSQYSRFSQLNESYTIQQLNESHTKAKQKMALSNQLKFQPQSSKLKLGNVHVQQFKDKPCAGRKQKEQSQSQFIDLSMQSQSTPVDLSINKGEIGSLQAEMQHQTLQPQKLQLFFNCFNQPYVLRSIFLECLNQSGEEFNKISQNYEFSLQVLFCQLYQPQKTTQCKSYIKYLVHLCQYGHQFTLQMSSSQNTLLTATFNCARFLIINLFVCFNKLLLHKIQSQIKDTLRQMEYKLGFLYLKSKDKKLQDCQNKRQYAMKLSYGKIVKYREQFQNNQRKEKKANVKKYQQLMTRYPQIMQLFYQLNQNQLGTQVHGFNLAKKIYSSILHLMQKQIINKKNIQRCLTKINQRNQIKSPSIQYFFTRQHRRFKDSHDQFLITVIQSIKLFNLIAFIPLYSFNNEIENTNRKKQKQKDNLKVEHLSIQNIIKNLDLIYIHQRSRLNSSYLKNNRKQLYQTFQFYKQFYLKGQSFFENINTKELVKKQNGTNLGQVLQENVSTEKLHKNSIFIFDKRQEQQFFRQCVSKVFFSSQKTIQVKQQFILNQDLLEKCSKQNQKFILKQDRLRRQLFVKNAPLFRLQDPSSNSSFQSLVAIET